MASYALSLQKVIHVLSFRSLGEKKGPDFLLNVEESRPYALISI